MALRLELQPRGPGHGRLRIGGPALGTTASQGSATPESVTLAIQRNDGRFLGADGNWQLTAHRHPQFSVEGTPGGIDLSLGPVLIDAIIGVGGAPLRIILRWDGREDQGILRIRGLLIGSKAAAETPPAAAVLEPDARLDPGPDPRLDPGLEPAPDPAAPPHSSAAGDPLQGTAPTTAPAAPTSQCRRWSWLLAAGLGLGALALGAWHLGWLDRLAPLAVDAPDTTAPQPVPAGTGADATTGGIAAARRFLAGGPTPAAIYARAEQADQAGDCPGAYALYSAAANADPELAARLARRYDPPTHQPSPCIGAPDIPYAIVYFSDAAEAGHPAVQRRLGQLMIEHESNGPTHGAGRVWLQRAAAAGDAEAARLLRELEDR